MLATALRGASIFNGAHPEEVSSFVNEHVGQHSLEMVGRERASARLSFREFAGFGLSLISYGNRVRVRSPELESMYHFQIITQGECAWYRGNDRTTLQQGQAMMVNPHENIDLEYSEDCEKLIIKVPDKVMNTALTSASHGMPNTAIQFSGAPMNLNRCPGLLKLLETVFVELEEGENELAEVSAPYREIILRKLLHVFPNNAKETRAGQACAPALSKMLVYIDRNLKQDIGIDELSSVSNTSVRSIYNLFSKTFSTTPKCYVKQLRLQKLREDLLRGSARNVTEVALDYGFTHLGRFSSDYKKAFGELPSETLRTA